MINREHLVRHIVLNSRRSRADARRALDEVLAALAASVAEGGPVALQGFGRFTARRYRRGQYDINAGVTREAERVEVLFSAAGALKRAVRPRPPERTAA